MGSYSNGWGHLIVTISVLGMSTFLIYTGKLDNAAVTGLLGSVISFWFMSGQVNRFALNSTPGSSSSTTTTVTASQQGQQGQGVSMP